MGLGLLLWREQSLHCLRLQPLTKPHPCPQPAGRSSQSLPPPSHRSLPLPTAGSPLSGLAPRGRGQELAFLFLWHSEAPAMGRAWKMLTPLPMYSPMRFCPGGRPARQSPLTAQ